MIALPLLASTGAAQAVDLGDFRKVKQNLDSLDQARADDEDYSKRFSFQNGQGDNLSIEDHKKRAKESFDRLQKDVKIAIDDKAYPRVSADIRHQLGTLRFDLKRVASAQVDKTARKQALQVQKAAFDSLADLDFAARKKSDSKLQETFAETVKRFGDVISSLG